MSSLHGTFEWFGNLYLKSGFEVGFVGASDDHRTNPGMPLALPRPFMTQRSGIAGVWASEKTTDAIFDALKSISAYATTGERMILDATLNGHPMGTRQPDAPRRRVEAKVAGTRPIDHIDVVKNGKVAFSRELSRRRRSSRARRSRSGSSRRPRSSSRPIATTRARSGCGPGRWRLRARAWSASSPASTTSTPSSRAAIRRIRTGSEFLTQTRGRMDTLLLDLDGAGPQTVIRFHLEPTMETGSKAGNVREQRGDGRPPTSSCASSGLVDGRIEHPFQVGRHTDRIALQVIDREAPLDQSFEYTDLDAVAPGDYYYVRVTQLDGNQAFSSPFWVGDSGRPPVTPSPITDLLAGHLRERARIETDSHRRHSMQKRLVTVLLVSRLRLLRRRGAASPPTTARWSGPGRSS